MPSAPSSVTIVTVPALMVAFGLPTAQCDVYVAEKWSTILSPVAMAPPESAAPLVKVPQAFL